MSTIRNKQRLIRLYRYLMENTDEDHQATTNDLVAFLSEEDANASRKTVRDDIKILIEEEIDVVTTKSYYNAYFIGNRLFEVPEVELLVDGIAANVSLTLEQKEKMIEKLLGTLSIHQAQKIRNRIVYSGSSKNKQSYYNIDRISEAINRDRKVRLQFFDSRYEGDNEIGVYERICVITPHFMTCCDNCYYVVGQDCGTGEIDAFRIDRITNACILEETGDPVPGDFSMEEYMKTPFRVQKGPMTEVVLKCNDEMMGEIMDVFGAGVERWNSMPGKFCVRVLVCASKAFYAWVFQYGGKINIVSPTSVLRKYAEMVCRAQGGGDGSR